LEKEYPLKPKGGGQRIQVLPREFIGDLGLLNGSNKTGYIFHLKTGKLDRNVCEDSLSFLKAPFKFRAFVEGVMTNEIDLDSYAPWRDFMHPHYENYKKHFQIKKKAKAPVPKHLFPPQDPKLPKDPNAIQGPKNPPKEKASAKGKEDDDEEEEESGSDNDPNDSDYEPTVIDVDLPNEQDYVKECRKITSKEVRDQHAHESLVEALDWALQHSLLKGVQFDNDGLIEKYKTGQLQGSGYFLTCREKLVDKLGEEDVLVAVEKQKMQQKRVASAIAASDEQNQKKLKSSSPIDSDSDDPNKELYDQKITVSQGKKTPDKKTKKKTGKTTTKKGVCDIV
jgi:hypothetical protein